MGLDETKLQNLVESMATAGLDGHTTKWVLDHSKAREFIDLIAGYVKKSANKSDRFDPEDAYGDIICDIWSSFQKYGPRPMGNQFMYLLRLKTNNVLTNRARKRFSKKSKLNYICESLDQLMENENGKAAGNRRIFRGSSYNVYDLVCSEKDENSPELYKDPVYNDQGKENQMSDFVRADEAEEGLTYLTPHDKLVTVVTKLSECVVLRVLVTEKEIEVPLHYQLRLYSGDYEDPVENVPPSIQASEPAQIESQATSPDEEMEEKEVVLKLVETSLNDEIRVYASDIESDGKAEVSDDKSDEKPREKKAKPKKVKKPKGPKKVKKVSKPMEKKEKKMKSKKESGRKIIISLLQQGVQTKETLALAIKESREESGNKKLVTDLAKLKTYAGILLSNLKRQGEYNMVKTPDGWKIES